MESFSPPPYDYLQSGIYSGIVEGTLSSVDNTTFSFSPKSPLPPNSKITILIGTKVRTKTIGTITPDLSDDTTGSIECVGPYIGPNDTFIITIRQTGNLGSARYSFRRTSEGIESSNATTDRSIELDDGLIVQFKPGIYTEGDTFTVEVLASGTLQSIVQSFFTTGSPAYTEVSSDKPSIQLIEREVRGVKTTVEASEDEAAPMLWVSSSPEFETSDVPLGFSTITITFSKEIDPDSLDSKLISVLMETLPMYEGEESSYVLPIEATVSGNKLIIRFKG